MVLENPQKHPVQLRDEVCSPGGTTICGIHALERAGVSSGIIDAIEASVKRAQELGKWGREADYDEPTKNRYSSIVYG